MNKLPIRGFRSPSAISQQLPTQMVPIDVWLSGSAPAKTINLPQIRRDGPTSLESVLSRRRSSRSLSPVPLHAVAIAQLAWSAQGIADRTLGLRTAPSAKDAHPLELYVALSVGLFRYLPGEHALYHLFPEDTRYSLALAAREQAVVSNAPAVFILSVVLERGRTMLGDRAESLAHLEAGHAAQNLLLAAEALRLGAVPIGLFDEPLVARLLRLNRLRERPIYLIPVGERRPWKEAVGSAVSHA